MGFIYKVTCKVNGKVYIGKTEFTVEERWKNHLKSRSYKHCCKFKFYRALNKYGVENFEIETIEETENTSEREIYWIAHYDSYVKGYNSTRGGEGNLLIDRDEVFLLYNEGKNVRDIANQLGISKNSVATIIRAVGLTPVFHERAPQEKTLRRIAREPILFDLYNQDLSTAEIARAAGVSVYIVQKFIVSKGLPPNTGKIDPTKDAQKATRKAVRCIELGMEFESIKKAAEFLNSGNPDDPVRVRQFMSSICLACRGKYKTSKGLTWEYV